MKYKLIYEEHSILYEDMYDLLNDYWTLENFGEDFDEFLDSTCETLNIPYYGYADISFVLKKIDWNTYEKLFQNYMKLYVENYTEYLKNEYELPLGNGMKILRIDEDEN